MSIRSSYQSVAEQILLYNKNVIDLLSKLNDLTLTSDPSVPVTIVDKSGIQRQFNLPSFGYLKSELDRLNNNLNSIYNINNSGALIQTSNNKYKKVVTVDLNKEPNDISSLTNVGNFTISKNWFFDSLLNPQLFVELDLTDKIENNVRKCLVRRYIVDFETNAGELTPAGTSALASFNALYRGQNNISIVDFSNWLATTPGIKDPLNVNYDEQMFDLEANKLVYNGVYSVLKIDEDILNKKLWYNLDTLKYVDVRSGEVRQLAVNDELIINVDLSTTRYKIIEVSTTEVNPRVRLERVEGQEPIPVGVATLKIYSPIFFNKTLRVSVGYNERNVTFIKALNMDNYIMSKNWSLGMGYWTNDLRLVSNDSDNGMTMEQYYVTKVNDYGIVLKDLTKKKIPNLYAATPTAPTLVSDSFKVVQINKHLTDTAGSTSMKQKHNQQKALKSEISQLNEAILNKNKQLKVTSFASDAAKKQFENEIVNLNKQKESKSKLLATLVTEILNDSTNTSQKETAKYRIRGFFNVPSATPTKGTAPQEVIQFRVQYRYLTIDGRETSLDTYKLEGTNSNEAKQKTAIYSAWNEYLSDVRKRVYDKVTDTFVWQTEDVTDGDAKNINQLDIPITANERVEIRIKSISEVGWPDSLTESDWSDILAVDFPEELNVPTINSEAIKLDAMREDLKVQIEGELTTRGLDDHLIDTTTLNNRTFHHQSNKILSGFKDSNNIDIDLFSYLQSLETKIRLLEEKINKTKGELEVIIYRNNDQFVVKNGSEITFNIECEDHLDKFTGTGIQTGRVYLNSIYVIKDYLLKVRNKSTDSPLGLLSNRDYTSTDIYNNSAPQSFWVDNQNELITSNITGSTKTQLNNQFIWLVNYEGLSQTSAVKLSDNIGNSFVSNKNNTITNILSSSEYNIGYSENSILSFVNNNNSLLDPSKWIDKNTSISSTTKLLSTVHPVIPDLDNIIERNSERVKTVGVNSNDDVNIPLNIYFKMNALDNTKTGVNYQYINLNKQVKTIKHTKKLKFFIESESENRPFIFTIKFVINRNRTISKKGVNVVPTLSSSLQDVNVKRRKSKIGLINWRLDDFLGRIDI